MGFTLVQANNQGLEIRIVTLVLSLTNICTAQTSGTAFNMFETVTHSATNTRSSIECAHTSKGQL